MPVYPTPVYLTGGEISLTATGSWVSPATGGAYPVGWELSINPSANNSGADSAGSLLSDLSLTLAPVAEDAEFPPSPFVPVDYWEGAVTAAGTLNGAPISGRGFVEMVGYAPRRALTPPAPIAQPPRSSQNLSLQPIFRQSSRPSVPEHRRFLNQAAGYCIII